MELIEALADGVDTLDVLKRVQSQAPPGCHYMIVTMPPFKTYRDRSVIHGLKELGWRLLGMAGRTAYLERHESELPGPWR